ncbi:MAG: prepilin peptidase [Rhodobacteraceae bacterium]|jgi:prepilin peptidase CpaA|nr:prepilin peptidase [Paracoccaceae bacterium]
MRALDPSAALVLLPLVAPIAIWVAWSDMKFMRIPNKAVVALAAVYLLAGPLVLPFADWAWGWAGLGLVLALGFVLNLAGTIGAGDAKYAAAMAPFVAPGDLRLVLPLFAAVLLGAFAAHRGLGRVAAFRSATADWESWRRRDFPMGLALSGTLVFYLALVLLR